MADSVAAVAEDLRAAVSRMGNKSDVDTCEALYRRLCALTAQAVAPPDDEAPAPRRR